MSTPGNVVSALSNANFWQHQENFWQLMHYLFVEQDGSPVWSVLPAETLRQLSHQLQAVIEATDTIEELQANTPLIYGGYFAIVTRIIGGNTCSEWMANEDPQVLKSVHHLYRTLVMLKASPLPLFGHVK
tara:strand:+ start:17916 stop:18305 length:390 start_codon:yes stop_codon:yes gene_type:complete